MASPPAWRNRRKFAVLASMMATVGCGILSLPSSSTKTTSPQRHRHPHSSRLLRVIGGFDDPRNVLPHVPDASVPDAGDRDPCGPDDFPLWWEDIDYDLDIPCGTAKCYFTSLSDPNHGYLIQALKVKSGVHGEGTTFLQAEQAYKFEKRLESDFGIRHFSVCPPFEMKTPEYFKEHLIRKHGNNTSKKLSHKNSTSEKLSQRESLVIQPSRSAPEGSVLFRCRKFGPATPTLDHVIARGSKGCEETLIRELADAISLLKLRPELARDWQVMVDLKGQFYHMDLQRAGKSNSARHASSIIICLEDAMAHVKDFYITNGID